MCTLHSCCSAHTHYHIHIYIYIYSIYSVNFFMILSGLWVQAINSYPAVWALELHVAYCRCQLCRKKFTTEHHLRKHHQEKHQDVEMEHSSQKDAVFKYTSLVMTFGLLRSLHNRAIQLGNGEDIMLLYRYGRLLHTVAVYEFMFLRSFFFLNDVQIVTRPKNHKRRTHHKL